MWVKKTKHAFVGFPTVEDWIGLPSEVPRRCWWNAGQQILVCLSADHDASMPMPGQQDAKTAGVEVEAVRLGRARKGMPSDDELVSQTLQAVCGLYRHTTKSS
jgi:hypothetical protein